MPLGRGRACAAGTVGLWATAATAFKLALGGLSVIGLLLIAAWVSAAALAAVLALQWKRPWSVRSRWRRGERPGDG